MRRSTRILCLVIALIFILGVLGMVIVSISYALPLGEKSETVYVTADAYGAAQSMLASVYLTNPGKLPELRDTTTLTGIQGVGSTEAPREDNGAYVFETDGEDVAYQGTAEGQLPVSMRVEYRLDGKDVPAEALAGASGHIAITVRFFNNSMSEVDVKGEKVSLYTPFTVISMLTLDESSRNVACENAKVMTGGGDATVTAVTFPGLAYDLDIDAKEQLAESFTVEADVENFSFQGIRAVIMTGLVDAQDISDTKDLDELISGIDDMQSAGDDLSKGAGKLYNGARELTDGVREYVDGAAELADGMWEAIDGSGETLDGFNELGDGIGALKDGIAQFSSSLSAGAGAGSGSMDPSALEAQLGPLGLNEAQLAAVAGIVQQTATQAAQQTAAAVLQSVQGGLAQLESGAGELEDGAKELGAGMSKLHGGFVELGKGASKLASEGEKLVDGAQELTDGLRKFRSGVREFNEEGISELAEQTGSMRAGLDRQDALLELGKEYRSFSGIGEGVEGTVRFVIETADIVPEKPLATPSFAGEAPAQPAPAQAFFAGIWDWIKRLFGG